MLIFTDQITTFATDLIVGSLDFAFTLSAVEVAAAGAVSGFLLGLVVTCTFEIRTRPVYQRVLLFLFFLCLGVLAGLMAMEPDLWQYVRQNAIVFFRSEPFRQSSHLAPFATCLVAGVWWSLSSYSRWSLSRRLTGGAKVRAIRSDQLGSRYPAFEKARQEGREERLSEAYEYRLLKAMVMDDKALSERLISYEFMKGAPSRLEAIRRARTRLKEDRSRL